MSKKRRQSTKAMKAARPVIYERAHGMCERCGTGIWFTTYEAHHRKLRSRGGDDSPENLAALCSRCHSHVHANPAEATRDGFMVPSWADPKDIPIGRLETTQ